MNRLMRWTLAGTLATAASGAWGTYHTFQIDEIFSNSDGTIQYVVLRETMGMDGQSMFAGKSLVATQGTTSNTYFFQDDLPGGTCDGYGCSVLSPTAYGHVLIATQGFADLHLLTPNFVVPNGFVPLANGTLNYAGVDQVTYSALPTDGVSAISRSGATVPNVATNFAGRTASVSAPASANYQGLWWASPASSESGWGVNFAHQGDTIFASWFTYDLTGKDLWLVMIAAKSAPNTYTGQLLSTTGPAFNAVPFDPLQVMSTPVGTGTLTFVDANNATFAYKVNGVSQAKAITREVFGTLPNCASATSGASVSAATNYQDLWWAKPANSESGWGINFTHQGDTIFATWFTYDLDHSPMWLVVIAPKTAPGVYSGALLRTTGPAFSATPFDPANVNSTTVGTATFTFSDGNNASFAYTVNGVAQAKAITREVFHNFGTVCQ